jgi:transcriptional regulator with XRE-family HTH domain
MNTSHTVTIGKNIRKYRESRGLTREQLAEAVSLDTGYLGMCERGERQLGLSKTLEIIAFFNIDPNDIFPCKEEAPTLHHKEYIKQINARLESMSDNELSAVARIIDVIQTI